MISCDEGMGMTAIRLWTSLVFSTALATAAPIAAEEFDLFRAMATVVSGQPASIGPAGELIHGDVVNQWTSQGGAFGGPSSSVEVSHTGPALCTLQQIWATQVEQEWATVTVVSYDFSKLTGVRYLADGDELETAPPRQPDDPAITTVVLSAPQWQCSRQIGIDPAKRIYESSCQDDWWITVIDERDREVVAKALTTIEAQCGGPAR